MSTIGDRLRIARTKRGLTQEALANLVQTPLTQGAIAHIEGGRSESSRHIVWIAAALHIRAEWLVTGKGEMFEEEWPWPSTPCSVVAELPAHVQEDIGDYIQMKLAKHTKKEDNGPTSAA
ncbi:helix-turn-helix domain-containing protein [Yanghanlia caeni]|uniref:Helix-turn-helix transcriptional regulator n=1 Tax=Yanghanlia caeni TaxID=3064283 RepID=A0ABU1DA05_9BURK|nr:helix-turn-helix transcriptional regulator [Alcaligenaceae bacterium LG-2]MEB2399642.1 helix-turn-helix transcriptional regulator [Alcaligenaceae bacterium]NYT24433.1 helix-turn-helix transcriptional regulator [Alcaligenaceae bacterium]